MSAVLTLDHVSKSFGARAVVQDLSLSVEPGEIFGLLGPNGAGKTTTIKMILGLLSLDAGDIFVDGHSITDAFDDAMAHVSGIVENPDMYKYLSGRENLRIQARACGADMEKVEEVALMVGMQPRLGEKFGTYSLGMKQRLGVAQALLHDPKLMILDEPTNGLDPVGIKEFRTLIQYLAHEKGIAVMVSSHILQEMQMVCDRVGIISNGRLIQVGTVDELTHQAGSRYRYAVRPADKAVMVMREHFPDQLVAAEDDRVDIAMEEADLPVLNQKLMENGVQIFGLQQLDNPLEDSYIAITGGGNTIA